MSARKLKRKIKIENGEAIEEMVAPKSSSSLSEGKKDLAPPIAEDSSADRPDESSKEKVVDLEDVRKESADESESGDLEKAVEENYDKYVRAVAELENLKKRNAKERRELIMYAGEGLARDLLEVLDSMEIAIKQEQKGSIDEFVKGLEMIHNQFQTILSNHSIKGESLVDKEFDPSKAEALASVPSEDVEPGTVIEEFKKAYFFKDKLLRPAQVVVSKEIETEKEEEPAAEDAENEAEASESEDT